MATTPQAPAGALRIGRVAGVPVLLDRSWVLLGLLVLWVGWNTADGLGTTTRVAYAVWLVVAILLAVLGHEVGHALVARLLGFRVHQVVATFIGGHTAYDGTGSTPFRMGAVAASGPVANLVLAGVGAVAASLTPWPVSFFAWSFLWMNLLLAGFNLLPGLPLDGGAVLQSVVWRVSGRRDLGTLVAGWAGRVVAVGVVLWFGVRPLLLGDLRTFDLLFSLFMGWVLWQGAGAAMGRVPLERLLRVVRPEDVLEPVHVVPALTPVGEVLGSPHPVFALDERGRPTLLVPDPASGGPDLAGLPPGTRLSSVVVRIPDDAVVDLPVGGDLEPVLRSLGTTGWGLVVVRDGEHVRGMVRAARLEAAAQRARQQN